nr:unknown [Zea mays]
MAAIGAGSAPLHYAAAGGEVRCCQILVARGADRAAANCNGWIPLDVARTWGCQWLEHVLSPESHLRIPRFPPSAYLSSPLASALALARDCRLLLNTAQLDSGGADACAVCLERPCDVAAEVCGHELCAKCALDLCSVVKSYDVPGIAGTIPCPLCRSAIASFRMRAAADEPEPDVNDAGGGRRGAGDRQAAPSSPEKKRSTDSEQDVVLPFYCAPLAVPS